MNRFSTRCWPGSSPTFKPRGSQGPAEGAVVVFTPGVEAPLIVEKSGGGYGYATTDLAAVRFRVGTLHADRVVYFVGATQSQHFKQVFAAAQQAGWAGAHVLEHAAFGSVLGADGKIFKTRSGETVKLADLLEEAIERGYALATSKDAERLERGKEKGQIGSPLSGSELKRIGEAVGIGAIKYGDLSKDRIGDYLFSWDSMLAMDGNTAPYLQYAFARIQSIFRRAESLALTVPRPFIRPVTLEAPARAGARPATAAVRRRDRRGGPASSSRTCCARICSNWRPASAVSSKTAR